MLLSRIRLDLNRLERNTLLQVLAGHAYTGHQLLWQLFSDTAGPRPFLFRQEIEHEQDPRSSVKGLPLFYVLSEQTPADTLDWLDVQTKTFDPQLTAGDRLGFVLRANPTVARSQPGEKRSRRSDVMMHAKYAFPTGKRSSAACKQAMEQAAIDWLRRQADQNGFTLAGDTAAVTTYRQQEIKKANSGHTVKFSSVDYQGVLQVTEPERFVSALAQGFGRAKAFGCGLMMIRRSARE